MKTNVDNSLDKKFFLIFWLVGVCVTPALATPYDDCAPVLEYPADGSVLPMTLAGPPDVTFRWRPASNCSVGLSGWYSVVFLSSAIDPARAGRSTCRNVPKNIPYDPTRNLYKTISGRYLPGFWNVGDRVTWTVCAAASSSGAFSAPWQTFTLGPLKGAPNSFTPIPVPMRPPFWGR